MFGIDNLAWFVAALAFLLALLASASVRRVLHTAWVATRAWLRWLGGKLSGHGGGAPREVRRAFEELGPTYIKLGQIIASSYGMFPEALCREFESCFDRVPPVPFDEAQRIVEAELQRPLAEVFAHIDTEPLASASIAQVYAARLTEELGGDDVVVKVQRPGIGKRVDADLRILGRAAWLLGRLPRVRQANPEAIIEDFDVTIHQELDFRLEATNQDEFNGIMAELGHGDIHAPRPRHDLTTRRVLVMERFHGYRVDDVAELEARQAPAEEMLLHGLRAWFQCMILYGFFHGDVHAGNLMALDDGGIGFLDFGIVGRFERERREQITDYLLAFAAGDFRRLGEVMLAMGSVAGEFDMDALSADLARAYEPLRATTFGNVKYADLLPRILGVALKYHLRLPREFVLVTKQMFYFDRYARLLVPHVNLFTDPRIVAGLAEDVLRAKSAPA